MSNLLPIIEELASARSHGERMDWVLRCPRGDLGKHEFTIRNRLNVAGFPEAAAYVEFETVIVRLAVRGPDGEDGPRIREIRAQHVRAMRARVEAAGDGGEAVR